MPLVGYKYRSKFFGCFDCLDTIIDDKVKYRIVALNDSILSLRSSFTIYNITTTI